MDKISRRNLLGGAAAGVLSIGMPPTQALSLGDFTAATGHTQQNVGSEPFWFKNFILGSFSLKGAAGALNANGYPAAGTLASLVSYGISIPPEYTGTWGISWNASGASAVILSRGAPGFANVSDPSRIVSGGTSFNLTMASTAPSNRATFTLPTSIAVTSISNGGGTNPAVITMGAASFPQVGQIVQFTSNATLPSGLFPNHSYYVISAGYSAGTSFQVSTTQFGSGVITNSNGRGTHSVSCICTNLIVMFPAGTYGTMSNLRLFRVSAPYTGDEAALASGQLSQMFNSDFTTLLSALNPRLFRMMAAQGIPGLGINFNNVANYSTLMPVDSGVGYAVSWFDPTLWAGATSVSNNYAYSVSSIGSGAYKAGEQVQFSNATDNPALSISAATVTSSSLVTITASTTGLSNGQMAYISLPGITGASGNFAVTVTGGSSFTISGTFSGSYTSGAAVIPQPTLAVGSRGAARVFDFQGHIPSVAGTVLPANSSYGYTQTFTYDTLLGGWVATVTNITGGGLTNGYPIQVLVALCNLLHKDIWLCFPVMATQSFATSLAAYVRDNLNSGLSAYFEYANENWNFSFPQFFIINSWANAYGFSLTNNLGQFSVVALKCAQFFSAIGALWSGGVNLRRTIAFQVGPNAVVDNYIFQGSQLNSASTTYWSLNPQDWSTNGQRPIDYAERISYAPYFLSQQARQISTDYVSQYSAGGPGNGTAGMSALLTNADLYATGNPTNMAAALSWFDSDVRTGTFTPLTITSVSGVTWTLSGGNTLNLATNAIVQVFSTVSLPSAFVANGMYQVVNGSPANGFPTTFELRPALGGSSISTTGSSGTLSVGVVDETLNFYINYAGVFWDAYCVTYPGKKVVQYEGGHSSYYPSPADCTTLGISTSYSQKILNLIVAYKQSALCKQMTIDQCTQFMALGHSDAPSQLEIGGFNQWCLLQGFVAPDANAVANNYFYSFSGDIYCAQFQTFEGIQAYNST